MSGYRTDLLHVAPSGVGRVKLRALTPEDVERLYGAVLASGCSAGSVAQVRRTLSAALNTAARRGHILRNPVPLADMPRADEEPEVEPYDAAEIAQLLTTARSRRNGVRWSLAFLGLRQGEALAVRWDNIDFDTAELRVRETLTWLPWLHGCVGEDAEPVCGRRASACPRRHGGGAHLGPPKSKAAAAASLSLIRCWRCSRSNTDAKPPNGWPPARCGPTAASSSPITPVDRSIAAPTPRIGSTSSIKPACGDFGCRHSAATALLAAPTIDTAAGRASEYTRSPAQLRSLTMASA
ncbi:MAG: site-specific integrase [Jatrophihabitans sp.]